MKKALKKKEYINKPKRQRFTTEDPRFNPRDDQAPGAPDPVNPCWPSLDVRHVFQSGPLDLNTLIKLIWPLLIIFIPIFKYESI